METSAPMGGRGVIDTSRISPPTLELASPGEWARPHVTREDSHQPGAPPLRVLFLASVYPPYPLSGSMRAEKVAQAFASRGHKVTVLTSPTEPGERGTRVQEPNLEVLSVPYPESPRFLWVRLKRVLGRTSRREANTNGRAGAAEAVDFGSGWVQLVRALLFLPDDQQGLVLSHVFRGLMRSRSSFDLIYTTAPPFSAHLSGYILHRLTGIPWVAEFRDPWTNNPANRKPRTAWTDAVEARLEAMVLTSADKVVVGTKRLLDELATRHGPAVGDKLLLVRNGIDTVSAQAPTPSPRPELLHLGSLYGTRSIEGLLEGLARVAGADADAGAMRVRFVGVDSEAQREGLSQLATSLGLEGVVDFEAWQRRPDALRTLAAADFPILLAHKQPAQVPNKLYEYLGTRKPIIALVDDDGESAHLLRRAGRHILITEDNSDAWESAFRRSLAMAREGTGAVSSADVLGLWSTDRQFDRLVDAIEGKRLEGE